MNNIFKLLQLLVSCLTLIMPVLVSAQDQKSIAGTRNFKVYQINLQDEINPGLARQLNKAMGSKEAKMADRILINMNTYGGLLDAADSIRTKLLNSNIPTIVFIDNNAASAGALIAIACEKIYMRSGASIGAATVVNESAEALPDKYQSYMRSMMRSTAEARGRDPRIAEAMVDQRISIPNVIDSGKVLTLTSTEALKLKYCDGIADNIQQVLKAEGITNYSITQYEATFIDKVIGFLILPGVSGVLILIMLGGIYYELQAHGIGFPLIAAVVAAILYFAPLYLDGLAANWEILLALIGFILIVLEIFIIPGFGVAGISGIILLVVGLATSMLRNDGIDFTPVSSTEALTSFSIVLLSMMGMLVMFLLSSKAFASSKAFNKMVLQESMNANQGYVTHRETEITVGDIGISKSLLRPSGKIEVNNKIYTASSESGYIEADENIVVTKVDVGIWVKKV